MTYASVFYNNRTQAVRLPADMRFDDTVKKVIIRKVGNERILTPMENVWDSFFDNPAFKVDESFQRGEQISSQREDF